MNGNVEVARILIENGANVNKVDKIKKTSLMSAALNGNRELAELLVENGANKLAVNEYGKTALDFAESFGRKEIVAYLKSLMMKESSKGVDTRMSHSEKVDSSEDQTAT